MLESSYSFIIITASGFASLVCCSQVSLQTLIKVSQDQRNNTAVGFRVERPFDGTSAFLHHDKMYYTVTSPAEFGLPSIQLVFL